MSFEQKMERSEQLLETNERNKKEAERSRLQLRQAQNRVSAGANRVYSCQFQLQQAIAARSAAWQQAVKEEGGGTIPASYDAAVADAESQLSQANRELQAAQREQIRATGELNRAEAAHRESAEQLRSVTDELKEFSHRYSLELDKTAQLLSMPEGWRAEPQYRQLGMGRAQVDDLRRRIAASLGITADIDDGIPTVGGHGARGRLRSLTGSGSVHRGYGGRTDGGNTYPLGTGVRQTPAPGITPAAVPNGNAGTPAPDPGSNAAAEPEAGRGMGGLLSRIFGKRQTPAEPATTFSGYPVDSHGFVHGANHGAYLSVWEGYDPEKWETTMYEGETVVQTVSADSIEGIRLSQRDVETPEIFWSQHKRGGTKESFLEIASHIPQVREALASGRSLSELLEDPELGDCAALYFDPERMPQVIAHDGFYEFQSNGRHRVLAARELGYEIPVRVIGSRRPRS